MAKSSSKTPKKRTILKRRGGQKRTKHAGLACYGYQKEQLLRITRRYNCSVSYYLNMMLKWTEEL